MKPSANTEARRYSEKPFPPYAYVPGKNPHPTRDPEGHSYNSEEVMVEFHIDDWQHSDIYLYGIDLFNHGYWWEAHEALEAIWHAVGRKSETGQFIQGLIQIAVAHLKRHQGFDDVALRMAKSGLEKMRIFRGNYLGINTDCLRRDVLDYFKHNTGRAVTIRLNNQEKEI